MPTIHLNQLILITTSLQLQQLINEITCDKCTGGTNTWLDFYFLKLEFSISAGGVRSTSGYFAVYGQQSGKIIMLALTLTLALATYLTFAKNTSR